MALVFSSQEVHVKIGVAILNLRTKAKAYYASHVLSDPKSPLDAIMLSSSASTSCLEVLNILK